LPPEIGNISLSVLDLRDNDLLSLPPEIGNLDTLQMLNLSGNKLSSLPPEIGNLTRLCYLDVGNNQLRVLPTELAQIQGLEEESRCRGSGSGFHVYGNPLISPPRAVIDEGTPAILAYLRNEAWWHLQKLIAGGASGLGLLAAIVLGLRWKNRHGRKEKEKRG
jgi:internalin A